MDHFKTDVLNAKNITINNYDISNLKIIPENEALEAVVMEGDYTKVFSPTGVENEEHYFIQNPTERNIRNIRITNTAGLSTMFIDLLDGNEYQECINDKTDFTYTASTFVTNNFFTENPSKISVRGEHIIVGYDGEYNNNSLLFSGTSENSIMTFPADTNYNFSAEEDFTFDFWVNKIGNNTPYGNVLTVGIPGQAVSFGIFVAGDNRNNITLGVGSNTWNWNNNFYTTSDNIISLNTWNHIAIVKKDSELKIYVNGTAIYTSPFTSPITCVGTLYFGNYFLNYNQDNSYFSGYLSNFRISREALFTEDFNTNDLNYDTNSVFLLDLNKDTNIISNKYNDDVCLSNNTSIYTNGPIKFISSGGGFIYYNETTGELKKYIFAFVDANIGLDKTIYIMDADYKIFKFNPLVAENEAFTYICTANNPYFAITGTNKILTHDKIYDLFGTEIGNTINSITTTYKYKNYGLFSQAQSTTLAPDSTEFHLIYDYGSAYYYGSPGHSYTLPVSGYHKITSSNRYGYNRLEFNNANHQYSGSQTLLNVYMNKAYQISSYIYNSYNYGYSSIQVYQQLAPLPIQTNYFNKKIKIIKGLNIWNYLLSTNSSRVTSYFEYKDKDTQNIVTKSITNTSISGTISTDDIIALKVQTNATVWSYTDVAATVEITNNNPAIYESVLLDKLYFIQQNNVYDENNNLIISLPTTKQIMGIVKINNEFYYFTEDERTKLYKYGTSTYITLPNNVQKIYQSDSIIYLVLDNGTIMNNYAKRIYKNILCDTNEFKIKTNFSSALQAELWVQEDIQNEI